MRWWLLVTLCACRIGFDPITGDAIGDDTPGLTTITFGERPTSMRTGVTADTYVSQTMSNANYGRSEDLAVSQFTGAADHSVLRFELSSIPAGTHVAAARLAVARLDYGDETPGTIEVRLVGESWVEGTRMGGTGTGATWTTRDSTQPWTTAGGTTTGIVATGQPSTEIVLDLDPAVVQGWIDAPATNAGVLLATTVAGAHMHLHAHDSTLDGMRSRPELAVDLAP